MVSLTAIEAKLMQVFHSELIEVIDDSHAHEGHGGYRKGEVTHIIIKLNGAQALSRVALHRKIYQLLALELTSGLHSVSIEVRSSNS